MSTACSGVILAGGLSSRFQGRNKAFFELNGRRIIDPIIDVFQSVFEDFLIVTNTPLHYLQYDVALVSDILPVRSSLTGIHAGLFFAHNQHVFVAACDTPFIKKEMVKLVISRIKPGAAAVMPETPAGMEPLFAVYSKSEMPLIERHLRQGKLKIQKVFAKKHIVKIPVTDVFETDPELASFFNINTEEDLARISGIWNGHDNK